MTVETIQSPESDLANKLANKYRTCTLPNSKVIHRVKWGEATSLCGFRPAYNSKGWKDTYGNSNCEECIRIEGGGPKEARKTKVNAPIDRFPLETPNENLTLSGEKPVVEDLAILNSELAALELKHEKMLDAIAAAMRDLDESKTPQTADANLKKVQKLKAERYDLFGKISELKGKISKLRENPSKTNQPEEVTLSSEVPVVENADTARRTPSAWQGGPPAPDDLIGWRDWHEAAAKSHANLLLGATTPALIKTARENLDNSLRLKALYEEKIQVAAGNVASPSAGNVAKPKKAKKPKAGNTGLRSDFSPDEFSQAVLELLGRWPHKLTSGSIALNLQGAPWFFDISKNSVIERLYLLLASGQITSYLSDGSEFYRLPEPVAVLPQPVSEPAEVETFPATEPDPDAPARSTWWDEIIDSADLTDEQVQFRISEPDLARKFLAYIADVRAQDMAMALDEVFSACPDLAAEAFSTYAQLLQTEEVEPMNERVEKIIDETSAQRLLQEVAQLEQQDTQEEAITTVIESPESEILIDQPAPQPQAPGQAWQPFEISPSLAGSEIAKGWSGVWHCATGTTYLIKPGQAWKGKPDRHCILIGQNHSLPGNAVGWSISWLQSQEGKQFSQEAA